MANNCIDVCLCKCAMCAYQCKCKDNYFCYCENMSKCSFCKVEFECEKKPFRNYAYLLCGVCKEAMIEKKKGGVK